MSESNGFRNGFFRIFGYAGAIGEALSPMVSPKVVTAGQYITSVYILVDVINSSSKKLNDPHKVSTAAGDALIWQTLASVVIPIFVANKITRIAGRWVAFHTFIPSAAALVACAGIVQPLDSFIDWLMDQTYRTVL